jgi:hypothetical protein
VAGARAAGARVAGSRAAGSRAAGARAAVLVTVLILFLPFRERSGSTTADGRAR